ncbi:hypothetical protein SteCoe_36951 [Stentor coeruleus]|uniref:EF-hand domain-containing protein n=1 Tax=Stentor coeruleus TaxID=5963 RepID=A0A1R2APE0_9CILI|nr:hypothetical protein SteCoe_36951 [Stentor coeruleus]
MISKLTETKICEFFCQIGIHEQEIEKSRETLCQNIDFEIYTSFRLLDQNLQGSLLASDFHNYLQKNYRPSNIHFLQLLILQYDTNHDGRLSINEFSKLVLPSTNTLLRDKVSIRSPYMIFSLQTQESIVKLIELELLYYEDIERIRRDLTLKDDFSLIKSFEIIDMDRNGVIDKEDIKEFVRKNGFYISDDMALGVIRRLDTDGDRMLDYVEYVDAVMPKKTRGGEPLKRSPRSEKIENFMENIKNEILYREYGVVYSRNDLRLKKDVKTRILEENKRNCERNEQDFGFKREGNDRKKSSPLRKALVKKEMDINFEVEGIIDARRGNPARTLSCITFFDDRKASPLRKSPYKYSYCQYIDQSTDIFTPAKTAKRDCI